MNSEIKLRDQARGTRIIAGELARERRCLINRIATKLEEWGASEIVLPSVEEASIYIDKAGPEILGQMYTFPDKGERELCLRPEGTATIQLIAQENSRIAKDTALWYEARCWRYERPQKGRYREFTQIGLEVLRPKNITMDECIEIGYEIVRTECPDAVLDRGASRGLAYYTDGSGWEVRIPRLGKQQQVLGGGPYAEGFGFAIGLDRILLAIQGS